MGRMWEQASSPRSVAAGWAFEVTRTLRTGVLAAGQELDARLRGQSSLDSGVLSWATKIAAAKAAPGQMRPILGEQPIETDVHAPRPHVVAAPRGMLVVMKPVNWEVDGMTSEGGGAFLLSSFVQDVLPRSASAIVYMSELDFGFMTRLDVPSSGLIIGGTSLEGLGSLKWQIAVYAMHRHYFVTGHGHFPIGRMEVDERIDATTIQTLRSVTDDAGKPARTYLSALSHLKIRAGDDLARVCIFVISIHTGRRHQIRAHTRHTGHPTVTDGLYTPRDCTMFGIGARWLPVLSANPTALNFEPPFQPKP